MNRWLARFSFSFLILAMLLAWQGWRELRGPLWRVSLYFVAAGISLGLAMRGIRARHRDE